MARNLLSLTISAPTSDPNQPEGGSFTYTVTPAFAGGGGVTAYDLDLQWDQGTATWQTIPGSGGLSTAGTAYYASTTQDTAFTITVDCNTAGSYNIRAINIDRSVTSTPSSQAVTVTASNIVIDGSQTPDLDPDQLVFTGKIPEVFREDYVTPDIDQLVLAGKIPTLQYDTPKAPDKDALVLAGKVPSVAVDLTLTVAPGQLRAYSARGLWLNGLTPTIVVSGGADVDRTPAEVDLALAGKVPTLLREDYTAPAIETLALAGKVPTLLREDVVAPGADPLVLSGQAPSVERDYFIDVTEETLALTGKAPTVTAGVATDTGALALAGKVPTILQTQSAAPSEDSLVLDGKTPTLLREDYVSPAIDDLALTGYAPSVERDYFIDVSEKTLALTGKEFSILSGQAFSPEVDALALSGQAPTVLQTFSAAPAAETLALSGQAPTVLSAALFVPPVDTLVLAGQAPSVERDYFIDVGADTLALTGKPPVALTGLAFAPPVDTLVLAGQAPSVERDYFIAVGAETLALAGQVPVIPSTAAALPEAATLTLTGQQPVRGYGLLLRGAAPTLSIGESVAPAADTLALTGKVPIADRGDVPAPAAGTLALTGQSLVPYAAGTFIVEPAAETLTFTGHIPGVESAPTTLTNPPVGPLTLTGNATTRARGLLLRGYAPNVALSSPKPGKGTLTLSGQALSIVDTSPQDTVVAPSRNRRELEGYNPVLEDSQTALDSSAKLLGYPPQAWASSPIFYPATGALTFTGHIPPTKLEFAPAADTLALSGQAPTLALSNNYAITPAAGALALLGQTPGISGPLVFNIIVDEATLSITEQLAYVGRSITPPAVARNLNGKVPLAGDFINPVRQPAAATLALSGQAPAAVDVGYNLQIDAATLTLNGQTLSGEEVHNVLVPVGELNLTGYLAIYQPFVAPGAATLTLSGGAGAVLSTVRIRRHGARLRCISLTTRRGIKMLYD